MGGSAEHWRSASLTGGLGFILLFGHSFPYDGWIGFGLLAFAAFEVIAQYASVASASHTS